LRERLPATLELSIAAALIALGVGVPLGVYTALKRNGKLSQALLAFSLFGVSLADVPDWYFVDSGFFCTAWLVAQLWARRHDSLGLVVHGFIDRKRLASFDSAG
jgi:ABC-type dipeptide/oligopeptide/nickel transport system permease component